MDAYAEIPIIILGCPQDLRQTAQIRWVEQELMLVEKLLMRFAVLESFQLVKSWPLSDETFLETIQTYRFNPSVKMIHLAGIKEGTIDKGIDDIGSLASYIGQFPYLQALYVSGFGGPELLDALLTRDIPAIIMTETQQSKQFAREMAHVFYSELGKGLSLEDSLIQVKENYPGRFTLQPVSYDIDRNAFNWKGKSLHYQQNQVTWGAYALENRADLEWKLPIPPVRNTEDIALGGGQQRQRRVRRFGLGILSIAILFILIISVWQAIGDLSWPIF
ncbi:MAG: hypothetical protein MRZ79_22060 [Bacteroidia bacterium]|nr:hypothetical protein [Bacteroidia bacterium]